MNAHISFIICILSSTMEGGHGYLPIYPLNVPHLEHLYVRGLGRNLILPYKDGLHTYWMRFMEAPESYRWSWQFVGLVIKRLKPAADFVFHSDDMDAYHNWKWNNHFSVPMYTRALNNYLKNRAVEVGNWTEAQCSAYLPRFEVLRSEDDLNYLHFKHQPITQLGDIVKPDRSKFEIYSTYHTAMELDRMGCFIESPSGCGWSGHSYSQPMRIKHAYYYWGAIKAFRVPRETSLRGAFLEARKGMTSCPPEVSTYIVYYLSTFDEVSRPPSREEFSKIQFLGNEKDYLQNIITNWIFNDPFVGTILKEKVTLELGTYSSNTSIYHCILEFHLDDHYDEVVFELSQELMNLLNWSKEKVTKQGCVDSFQTEEGGGKIFGSWQLSHHINKSYALTLRVQSKAHRRVRVDMSMWQPPLQSISSYKLVEYEDKAELNPFHLSHSGQGKDSTPPPIICGVSKSLPPTGLRLIQVVDKLTPTDLNGTNVMKSRGVKVEEGDYIFPLNKAADMCKTKPMSIALCDNLQLKFLIDPMESGRRKMFNINEMVFVGRIRIVQASNGESLSKRTPVEHLLNEESSLYFQNAFFKSITVVLLINKSSSEDGGIIRHVLFKSSGEKERENERHIMSMICPPCKNSGGYVMAEILKKRFSDYNFNGSVSVDIRIPLFIYGEMPPYHFYSTSKIEVEMELASPNNYLKTAWGDHGVGKPLALVLNEAQLYIPSKSVDEKAMKDLEPILEESLLSYIYDKLSFEHDIIEMSEVEGSSGYTYSHTIKFPHSSNVVAYILAVSDKLKTREDCFWAQHGLFSIQLEAKNESVPSGSNLRPEGWIYRLGFECDNQKEIVSEAHKIYQNVAQLPELYNIGLRDFINKEQILFTFIPQQNIYPREGANLLATLNFPSAIKEELTLTVLTISPKSITVMTKGDIFTLM